MTYSNQIKKQILLWLKEDIGKGDITTQILISPQQKTSAEIIAKEELIVCGIDIAKEIFKCLNPRITFKVIVNDGKKVRKGARLALIKGKAKDIITAERVALNILSHLSGIATTTNKFVSRIKPYKARIIDTRKTLPGLRTLEKYAVRTGGGFNHRMDLNEMILVKDNHLELIGGIKKLKSFKCGLKTEIEVKNINEFKMALSLNPDIIMLDNMPPSLIKLAAKIRNSSKPLLEASGGINLKNVRRIAASGVDLISIGALTHSAKASDISLEITKIN